MNTAILDQHEQKTCRDMSQTQWEVVSRLTDELTKVLQERDALIAAGDRVLKADSSMELDWAQEALYKAVHQSELDPA